MLDRLKSLSKRFRWPPWQPTGPVVPVIRLAGVIGGGGGALRGEGLSLNAINGNIERAFKVRGATAVALAINSPGGSPVQSALITDRIRTLAAERELPVLAFIEDIGASGGYWLALAADEIFADANSLVGSIGVISAGFGLVETMKRFGVERRVYTAGEYKSLLDPFRPEDQEGVARLRVLLEDAHTNFKAIVHERRGDRLKGTDAELFEGQVWAGGRALDIGLIDGLGNLHGVLKERFGDELKMPLMTRPRPWWQRRFGLGSSMGITMGAGMGTDIGEPRAWIDGTLDSLTERAIWAQYGL
ncbi:MAG: S49 family peptidase [Geminicoccaceae bacterium]